MKSGSCCTALYLVMVTCGSAVVADAQPGREEPLVGSRVRVETAGSEAPLVGLVVDADTNRLYIRNRGTAFPLRVAREDVLGLKVSRGYRRRTAEGLLLGVLAWGVSVGVYAAVPSLGLDQSGVGEPGWIASLIAMGGLFGSLIKTERWEPVPLSRVSLKLFRSPGKLQAAVVLRF